MHYPSICVPIWPGAEEAQYYCDSQRVVSGDKLSRMQTVRDTFAHADQTIKRGKSCRQVSEELVLMPNMTEYRIHRRTYMQLPGQ